MCPLRIVGQRSAVLVACAERVLSVPLVFFGLFCLRSICSFPFFFSFPLFMVGSGRVAQSVGHLTRKSGVLGSISGLATYFRFSFRFFKKGSCQLLAKVCARSTG